MRQPRQIPAAVLTVLLAAGAFASPDQQAAQPAQPSRWEVVIAHANRGLSQVTALAASADQRLRAVCDSAGEYLNRHGAAAPRMRGVHILAGLDQSDEEPEATESALGWAPLADTEVPDHIVLLIHGLDEPGRVWDDLAPALHARGRTVARFDYPNDQPIAATTELLAAALRDLHAQGVRKVDVVGHSMGGLVARDVLTCAGGYAGAGSGHKDLPHITRLVTLGTPHHGSPWAHLQCVSDAAEQVDRFATSPDRKLGHLLGFLADGRGEAARDLLPGSEYLTELNARPLPEGVAITTIIGVIDPTAAEQAAEAGVFSLQWAAQHRRALTGRLGDGVVSTKSAQLEGVEDVVFVGASHRGMVRRSRLETAVRWTIRSPQEEPPAIPLILERLIEEVPEGP